MNHIIQEISVLHNQWLNYMTNSRKKIKIIAMLLEVNYVPQPHIESASMLTSLYCTIMIQAETHQLFQGKVCTNTILLKI